MVHARSWWMWVAQPWRSAAVAGALVGSLSLPALLLASGPMFRTSASDAIATRVAGDVETGPAGLVVSALGALGTEELAPFASGVERRLEAIDALDAADRTLFSDSILATPVGAEPNPRWKARVLNRSGAADAVELLDGEVSAAGVLIPRSLADELGLAPGDELLLGASGPVPVSGVYRDLWDGEPDAYWRDAPSEIVPGFQRVFNEPSFELVIAPEKLFSDLGLGGRVRWDAPLASAPHTWDGLRAITASYRRVERALVRDETLLTAYGTFARDPEDPPDVFTALFTAEERADALIAELERPIRTVTIAGVVAGLVLSTAGAIFLVRRYRTEHRLMAADGDAAARFFGRALTQYASPALAGGVIGVGLAWTVITLTGPGGRADMGVVPWGWIAIVSALACVIAALVTAAAAVRLTDALDVDVGAISTTWLALLVGAVAVMWVQVGDTESDTLDPSTVAFPLLGILAGVVLTVVVLRVVLRAVRRTGGALPVPLFLAWRALTASAAGALALTAALGLATGFAVLSSTFVDSIDVATNLKATTAVGATSRIQVIDRVDPGLLPPDSTILRTWTTEIGEQPVDVIALDPATFAAAVRWPSAFGGSAESVIADLADDGGDEVPILAVGSIDVPRDGELGAQRVYPYSVVGSVRSAPLASDSHATVLVRADTFDAVARRRWEAGMTEIDPIDEEVSEVLGQPIEYESPLDAFGTTIVSRQPVDVLETLAEQQGWRIRESASAAQEVSAVEVASTRWAFDYLRILSMIAGAVALTALAFYLAERRAQRQVAAVMTEQMGISRRANVLAAVAEVVGLVAASLVVGVVTALVTARRVFPVFEPHPELPPTVGLSVDAISLVLLAGGVVLAVSIAAAWAQRSASAAQKSEVLRG